GRRGGRPVGRVYIEPLFDFAGVFQSKLAAWRAGVGDVPGRIGAFIGLSRNLAGQQQRRDRQEQLHDTSASQSAAKSMPTWRLSTWACSAPPSSAEKTLRVFRVEPTAS